MVNVRIDKSINISEIVKAENNTPKHDVTDELITAIIILGVTVFLLLLIILCGYCKYIRKKLKPEDEVQVIVPPNRRKSSPGAISRQLEPLPEETVVEEITPVSPYMKTRKRSMTFTETDEDCRKYREDLINSYETSSPQAQMPSRKKSSVTFVGVERVDV